MTNEWDKFDPALGLPVGGNTERQQISELQAQLQAWEELWRAIKEMEPELGDANKPLAIAASYALLKQKERDFEIALTKIMDFTGGYDDIAGIVNRIARDAMRDNAPSTGEPPHGLKETSPGRLGGGAPTGTDFYNQGFKDGISSGLKSRIQTEIYLEEARRELAVCLKQSGNWREFPSEHGAKYRLQYNKLTRKIDLISLVTGLVADSFDPPEECYC